MQLSVENEHDSSQKHNLNLRKSTQGTGMGQLDHLRTATVLGQLSRHGNETFQSSPGVISNFGRHEYA